MFLFLRSMFGDRRLMLELVLVGEVSFDFCGECCADETVCFLGPLELGILWIECAAFEDASFFGCTSLLCFTSAAGT